MPEPDQAIVRVFTVGQANESDLRTFPGFAKEARRTKASFRIPGELCELNATLGAAVNQDDVLAKLDPRDFELAVERLEYSLTEANAIYTALKTGARAEDVASLKSQLEAAKSSEETDQLDDLREIGCDYIQGFLWGKPMSPEDAAKLIEQETSGSGDNNPQPEQQIVNHS